MAGYRVEDLQVVDYMVVALALVPRVVCKLMAATVHSVYDIV